MKPTGTPARRTRLGLTALALALAVVGCHSPAQPVDPSWNPFKACPPGMVRVKDVTLPASRQWACER